MRGVVPAEPYHQRLRRLRRERGLSQPQLYRLAEGVSFDMIRAMERDPARATSSSRPPSRAPSADMLARVSRALGVPPEEFPEYRLAQARRALDPRAVGLDRALAALQRVERDLLG